MFIKDIFLKDVGREIQSVIKVSSKKKNEIVEIDEYVVTDEIFTYIERFVSSYKDTFTNMNDEIGFWISGFFGSGKSHFLKILYYILKGVNLDLLIKNNKCLGKIRDELKFVSGVSKDVVLFNIDSKNRKEESILDVFVNEFNGIRRFSSSHGFICELEEQLCDEGIFDKFREEFRGFSNVSWEDARDKFYFYREHLVRALSVVKGFDIFGAESYFDNIEKNYKMNIDTFAKKVNEYIGKKGESHSVVFMVDEVSQFISDDINKILNLQTIVEELSTKCFGRAFVVVTSHVDILNMVNDKRYDFSKIQGRFKNKFHLSSINIGEVLTKRLLLKRGEFRELIGDFYNEKKFFIKTKLGFDIALSNGKSSINREMFVSYYPFLPYQLDLIREVIFYMMRNNVISSDMSKGERSLINCFQKVLVSFKDFEVNHIVPFYMFYDAISDFIDYNHQYIFSILKDYAMLDEFDINVLKTLFLIKYVPNVVANIDTISSLMVVDIGNESNIKNKINNSLLKLINEGFVNKDGDKFYFLSKNERDINYKIIRGNVDSHEIRDLLCREIFDEAINITKFKYQSKSHFNVNQILDDFEYKVSGSGLIGIKVLMTNYDENFKLDFIRVLSTIENNVVVYFNDDRNLIEEINLYLKLDKFLKYNKSNYKDEFSEIINQKEFELKNRLERVRVLIEDNLRSSKVFVNGECVSKSYVKVSDIFENALNELILCKFNKFSYIERFIDSNKKLLEVFSDDDLLLDVLRSNALFIKELFNFISNVREIKVSDVLHHFKQIPYGFNRSDVLFGILYLIKENKVSCEYGFNEIKELLSNKGVINKLQIKIVDDLNQRNFSNYKRLLEELFNRKYFVDNLEELKEKSLSDFDELLSRVERVYNVAIADEVYPDREFIAEFRDFIDKLKENRISDFDEESIILMFEKFEIIYNFYTSIQFEIFNNGINAVKIFNKDKNFIVHGDEVLDYACKIREILNSDSPYGLISRLKVYTNSFFDLHTKSLNDCKKIISSFICSEISSFVDEALINELKEKLHGCSTLFDVYGIKMEGIFLRDKGMKDE